MTLVIDRDRLSETFAALANSTRRAILARLAEGEANVNDLAGPFELTLPAVSKHIKVLERAGLVVRGQRAQYRPCTLDPAPLEEISGVPRIFRTADPYRIFTGKDGITWQGNTGSSLLSFVRKRPVWSWKRHGRSRTSPASSG